MELDKRTKILFQKIAKLVPNDEYVILKKVELLNSLPYKSDLDRLGQAIDFLKKNDLVAVKYTDTENICITITPSGRFLQEENEHKRAVKIKQLRKNMVQFLWIFLAAFAGAIVGNIIFSLFASLI